LLGDEQIKDAIHDVQQAALYSGLLLLTSVSTLANIALITPYFKEEAIPVLCRLGNGLTEFPPMFCNSIGSHTPQGRGG
jgi:hypothetical protein